MTAYRIRLLASAWIALCCAGAIACSVAGADPIYPWSMVAAQQLGTCWAKIVLLRREVERLCREKAEVVRDRVRAVNWMTAALFGEAPPRQKRSPKGDA